MTSKRIEKLINELLMEAYMNIKDEDPDEDLRLLREFNYKFAELLSSV